MNKSYTFPTFDDEDDYPKITQSDLDRATFRVGLKPAPRKQRVTIMLDSVLIEYFRARAGGRGYQTLINDALRQAIEREELEDTLRRVIREERGKYEAVMAKAPDIDPDEDDAPL
ncbi:MAG: BrnA antitoxin family protein [Ardenticatenaceae bacterium]|nr:BrnA antitoxin family protein [Ardenticatenaceae bacterium]MCB8989475.1 BrnA antitoxin family protein [Ardenticatenaceae bacterium]